MLAGFATGLHHLLEIVIQDLDESGFSKTFSSSLLFSAPRVTHPLILLKKIMWGKPSDTPLAQET
jgi:hypothetical protein